MTVSIDSLNAALKAAYDPDYLADVALPWREYCERRRKRSDERPLEVIHADALEENVWRDLPEYVEEKCEHCGAPL